MAVNWKKILVFLARRVWFFSAALLVTLAVLVSLGRQAIDGLESYRPALNEYVSELLGVRFRAQRLSGSWEKLIPSITAEDIALFGDADQTEPAMTLSSLTFDLNFFQSLFSWELIWHELTFGEARLTLQENRQGQWSLAGLSMGGGASGSNLLDVIFLSDHIEIAELQVTLAFYSGTRTIVNARDMVVESDGDFHRLHASLALDGQQESARLVLEGVDDTGSYQDFFGSGYLKLSRINFDGSVNAILKNWFPELVARVGDIQSDLDAEFWIDLQGLDKFEWVGLVRADEIPMNWLADAEPLKNFRAEATGWFSAGNSWGMRWQGVDFDWGEFDIEPFNAVYSQQMGGNWGSGSLYFNRLNVATFAELLQGTKLPPEAILNALDNLQPKGVLKRIHLQIGLQEGDPAVHARMNMDDISIASWHGAPASRQINGYAEFYSEQGVTEGLVELDSPDGFAMYYPAVYPDYMEHSSIKGQVRWRWDQVDSAVKVASGPIAVGGAEGVGRAYLYLDIPVGSDRVPEMFLLAGVKNTHSRYRNRYLPETLNDGLRTWLEYAPTDIDVAEAGFIWRGALKGEHSGRTVQLHLNVENSELAFQPDWLPLKAFNARIDLDDTEFNGAVTKGMLGNVRIDSADVSLISSKETDSTLLLIKAKAEGDMGEVLSVLHQSPLAERVSALQDWNISGNSYLDLDLAIPLTADKAGEHYRVDTTFGNARFTDIAGDLVFEKLEGSLRYRLNDGLNAKLITGTFWDQPLRAKIVSEITGDGMLTKIQGSGMVAAEKLSAYLSLPQGQLLSGGTRYSAELQLPFTNNAEVVEPQKLYPRLSVSSDLKGLAVDLPRPFAKKADDVRKTALNIGFNKTTDVNIHFGDLVDSSLELRNGEVVRGALAINQPLTEMPEQGQFSVGGYLSRMDLSEWRTVYGLWQNNGASLSVGTALMPKLDLRFDQAEIGEFRLRDVLLKGARQGSQWQLNLDSDLAAGDVIILPDADRSLTIALSRLSLPKADDSADPLKNINPADIPAVNFSVQDFSVGANHYGSASFAVLPQQEGALFNNIRAKFGGLFLGDHIGESSETSLLWLLKKGQHSSEFDGVFHAGDIGEVLEQRGMAKALDSKEAYFRASLGWQDTPANLAIENVEGSLAMELNNGKFYKSPGAATNALMRTISLFNFANWARRLRLDFSDLFQKGMDYKNLHGGLIFNRGVMHFDPALVVEMSSGRMKMLGNANLITEQIDATLVTTLPVGTNLPWMAALVGGLPAAAGVYVTGKIFKKQVDQLSSIGYSIKGSWDDPSLQVNQIFSDSLRKAKGVDNGATLPENGQPDQKVDLQ